MKNRTFLFSRKNVNKTNITRQQLTPYFYRPLNLNCMCRLFIILERLLLLNRFRNIGLL